MTINYYYIFIVYHLHPILPLLQQCHIRFCIMQMRKKRRSEDLTAFLLQQHQ